MNKSMLAGTVLGAAVALTGGAFAGYKYLDKGPQFADVLDVKAVTKTIVTPRQDCRDEQVTHQRPAKDRNRIAGTAIGAVLGGLLGHQIGGGNGKTLATVAGAAAGGYAGNQVQDNMQQRDTYTTTEQRCQTVNDRHQKVIGYDVKYRIGDKVDTVRMDHKPGDRIPLKDGKLALNDTPEQPAR